ncbi:MAG: flagellar biosynthetic protein FliP [Chloroflexota bacterium]
MRKLGLIAVLGLLLVGCAPEAQLTVPGVSVTVNQPQGPQQVVGSIQLLLLITVLSLAPAVLILMTGFTRIVIVLSIIRSAIGTPQIPPNQVVVGLALVLTLFVMAPVWGTIHQEALQPYLQGQIDQQTAADRAIQPLRAFMLRQTREKDLSLFLALSNQPPPATPDDVPTSAIIPAFVISELKTAFQMGFILFVPFLIIDIVVSSALLSMGMMMLPPSLVSLPFKLLLFVMVDGWYLVVRSLVMSFH